MTRPGRGAAADGGSAIAIAKVLGGDLVAATIASCGGLRGLWSSPGPAIVRPIHRLMGFVLSTRAMTPHYPQSITTAGHVEPVARRIRAELNGATVVDTTAAYYLWTWPFYPRFQIPRTDIDPGSLTIADEVVALPHGTGKAITLAPMDNPSPPHGHLYVTAEDPALIDTVYLEWDALDVWYEEDEQVFVHPRNPYVRVDALRSTRHVRIERGGVLLAESHAPVMVCETGLPTRCYLDRSAVDFSHLRPSDTVTACPYKGRTTGYWSVEVDGHLHPDLAWSYDFPTRQLLPIAGLVAFYDERVDVTIDGVAVPRPQTHF